MSSSSSSIASTSSHAKSGTKRSSSGTIESSVTRLLVSTKHLLESLNQWAKEEADDKFVSDAYVKLGNDFRASTRAFTNAGIDISDIGDVPQALRIILEAALSEAPSQENLDRFLPNIRNIIVTLIQNLKVKQAKVKSLAQEKQKSKASTNYSNTTRINSSNNQNNTIVTNNATVSSNTSSINSNEAIKTSPPPNPSAVLRGNVNSKAGSQSQSKQNDALVQLQKGNFLSRRASKRFSAYQYAKLANFSPSNNNLTKSPSNDNRNENDVSIESIEEDTFPSKRKSQTDDDNTYIFLKLQDKTKKVDIKSPVSFASLRLLFVEKFAYSPGTASFPEIYIQDPKSGIFYELEDHLLEIDLKSGSVLSLNQPDLSNKHFEKLELQVGALSKKLESLSTNFVSEIKDVVSSVKIPVAPSPPPIESKSLDTTQPPSEISDLRELDNIQRELKIIRQLQASSKKNIKVTVDDIVQKLKEFQDKGLGVNKSSNRLYMEESHLKLSEESDLLLTQVDDLQDVMDALRKDVAQRGVRIGEKQLKNTQKEIESAQQSLSKMCNYMTKEKVVWKKIWEAELDKVCEEQQFFNLQDDLTKDLEEDIKRIQETFNLITQCSLEQSKSNVSARNRFVPQLHIPEPGESLHNIKDAVLSEVAALRPNHESRLEAIAKAEKIREKERMQMSISEFQEELGSFVDDNKLKKSGGVEEIERVRQIKDSENLKSSMGFV